MRPRSLDSFRTIASKASAWAVLLTITLAAPAQQVDILDLELRDGRVQVTFTPAPDSYHLLYRGEDPAQIDRPVAIADTASNPGLLTDPGEVISARFYQVRQVPNARPLDIDGDGLDDLYEWTHLPFLDPFNAADALEDPDRDGRTTLREYQEHTDPFLADVRVPVTPTFLPPPDATTASFLTFGGTASTNGWVRVEGGATVVTNDVSANGAFEITVPLGPNRLNRLFVSIVERDGNTSPPRPFDVLQDSQPPTLDADFPTNHALTTAATTVVAGRVGDMLSGFKGLNVWVHSSPTEGNAPQATTVLAPDSPQRATVDVGIGPNGTFERGEVPLQEGTNLLTVVATDQLGNPTVRRLEVVRLPLTGNHLTVVSGDRQMTNVQRRLAEPIVVRALKGNGSPLAGKRLLFEVTRNNGRLLPFNTNQLATDWTRLPNAGTNGAMALELTTDAAGEARAWWTVGNDAGCGNNRVCVTGDALAASVFFCASAMGNPARQVNIGSGNNQKGEAGAWGSEPLKVWVSDGLNPVAGVPVTFRVVEGGALVSPSIDPTATPGAGATPSTELTVLTRSTGHAEVRFLFGPESGVSTIEANFADNRFLPATFTAYGLRRDPTQPGSFTGLVLDNTSCPIGGAYCELRVANAKLSAFSDGQGRFRFDNVPGGTGQLFVNGAIATSLFTNTIPTNSFPSLTYAVLTVPNAENSLPTPVLLPRLNPKNAQVYRGTNDLVLTCEGIEGLKMTIKANSMVLADGRRITPDNPTVVSLNQVHHDNVPMPMPDGASPPFAWTLQPAGAHFDPPIEIEYPNMSGLAPGSIAYFLSFNHDTERFEIVASGHVNNEGSTIQSDPNAGLTISGWGCNCPPYAVSGECESCPKVQGDSCMFVTYLQPQPRLRLTLSRAVTDPEWFLEDDNGRSLVQLSSEGTSATLTSKGRNAGYGQVKVGVRFKPPENSGCSGVAYTTVQVIRLEIQPVATTPGPADRLQFGVGEHILCRVSPSPATASWTVLNAETESSASKVTNPEGPNTTFVCGDRNSIPRLMVEIKCGTSTHRTFIPLQVKEPEGYRFEWIRELGLQHLRANTLAVGAAWRACVLPTDVSFQFAEFEEGDSPIRLTGWFLDWNWSGTPSHCATGGTGCQFVTLRTDSQAPCQTCNWYDYTELKNLAQVEPPFWEGDIYYQFRCRFRVPESNGKPKEFTTVRSGWHLDADGRIHAFKGVLGRDRGTSNSLLWSDPQIIWDNNFINSIGVAECPQSDVFALGPAQTSRTPTLPDRHTPLPEFEQPQDQPLDQSSDLNSFWRLGASSSTTFASDSGSFAIQNVSAPDSFGDSGLGSAPDFVGDDFIRVIGQSSISGYNRYVFSEFFKIRQGETTYITNLTFTDTPPRKAESLTILSPTRVLTTLGTTNQLKVVATYADGTTNDVTARTAWTSYRISNPTLAQVSADGAMVPLARGRVLLTATSEGASAVLGLDISPNDALRTITGRIVDTNGLPVSGAMVRLYDLSVEPVTTDSGGQFSIEDIPTQLGEILLEARVLRDGSAKFAFWNASNPRVGVSNLVVRELLAPPIKLSAGGGQTMSIRRDGSLWAWGRGTEGQLGNGKTDWTWAPIRVLGSRTWKSVSCGLRSTLAIASDDSLWGWGWNRERQLGFPSGEVVLDPVQVGTNHSWRAVSSGVDHTLAIASDGTLWAWGANEFGQLGDGTRVARNYPVPVDLTNSWLMASAGERFSVAIRTDGTMWSWGYNEYGQLGNGGQFGRVSIPQQIGRERTWTEVSAGGAHCVAVSLAKELWTWGSNDFGELGDSRSAGGALPNSPRSRPGRVPLSRPCAAAKAGYEHSAAIDIDGLLWMWGKSRDAGFGGPAVSSGTFQPSSLDSHSWLAIDSGSGYSTGLAKDGRLYVWGNSQYGHLANGSTPYQVGTSTNWIEAWSGRNNFAVDDKGSWYGWGDNDEGQLGDGSTESRARPILLSSAHRWTMVRPGGDWALALADDHTLWQCGSASHSRLDIRPPGDRRVFARVDSDLRWIDFSVCVTGGSAITQDGRLWAWGDNSWGQIGDGTTTQRPKPVLVIGQQSWATVSVNTLRTFAVDSNDKLWGWGRNEYGAVGDGTTIDRSTPVAIEASNSWRSVVSGTFHTLALTIDGRLWAWGRNNRGQLGTGVSSTLLRPTLLAADQTWTAIGAGEDSSFAIRSDGSLWAWGFNRYSVLGDGTTSSRSVPIRIGGDRTWRSVTTTGEHTLAVAADGSLWAWGLNESGLLGIGSMFEVDGGPVWGPTE